MAHIEVESQHQQESQPKGKKKFKLTRKNIIIYGGVAVGLIVLLMMLTRGRQSTMQQDSPIILPPAEDGLPTAGMPIGGIPNYQDDINKMQEQMALSNESMLNTMTEVFSKIQGSFDDKLLQQQSRYENQLMQQQDKFSTFAEQNKEYMQQLNQKSIDDQQRYNEQINLLQQQQQQWQQQQSTIWQPTPTPTPSAPPTMPTIQGTVTSSQSVATLRTGTFKSSNDAYTLLGRLQNDYGASNARVVNENGLFRVIGDFSDAARANSVGSRIQQLGYVQQYHTS